MEDSRFKISIQWVDNEIPTELEMVETFENQELIRSLSGNVLSDAPIVKSVSITRVDEDKPSLRPMNEVDSVNNVATLTPRSKK